MNVDTTGITMSGNLLQTLRQVMVMLYMDIGGYIYGSNVDSLNVCAQTI